MRAFRFRYIHWLFMGALFTALAILSSCSDRGSGKPEVAQVAPVVVGAVVQKAVPVELHAIGNVQAYATVSIKSQVGGELTEVHFLKGQDVKKGDLLFVIDPRPHEVALKQAQARLARDIALYENSQREAQRNSDLLRKGFVSKEQYEQSQSNSEALKNTVNADRADVDNARLQLNYCYVYSPITGRTGNLLVDQGNLIKANDDKAMVTINQVQPIYVDFSVPEQNLAEIKKYSAVGRLRVSAVPTEDQVGPLWGELTFIDNAVDKATGTILLKATFPNENKALWPGQFVNVTLTLTTQPDAIVVPPEAIQAGQQGEFVFVVKPDLTVESRPVEVVRTLDHEAIVGKGLHPGETVVTDGQLRLVPGTRVEIKDGQQSNGVRKP